MSYYSTVYGQRSKLDLIYTAFFTGIAFSRRRTRLHQPPSVCKSSKQFVILFAEDTRVALGWREFNLLTDQTHASGDCFGSKLFTHTELEQAIKCGMALQKEPIRPAGRWLSRSI